MLSRTAECLFWMARYMERAENMARLIGMGRRMSAIPSRSHGGRRNEWFSILLATGGANGFLSKNAIAEQGLVIPYMILDRDNPSSLVACFENARANARAARGALTVEMWEALNDSWIELRELRSERLENGALNPLLDWVRQRAALFRGAAESTALRNDGYEFLHLGHAIERLDCTARLLDIKYFAADHVIEGDAVDHYVWASILHAAGVLRAYHAAYRAEYEPRRIAEFLIFDPQCPRSIRHCVDNAERHLAALAELYGEPTVCHDLSAGLRALLDASTVDTVFERQGLHSFLSDVIGRNAALSTEIAVDYHFSPTPVSTSPAARRPAAAAANSARQHQGAANGAFAQYEARALAGAT